MNNVLKMVIHPGRALYGQEDTVIESFMMLFLPIEGLKVTMDTLTYFLRVRDVSNFTTEGHPLLRAYLTVHPLTPDRPATLALILELDGEEIERHFHVAEIRVLSQFPNPGEY